MSGQVIGRAIPRVLSIAGTDPSGGAGIQADLKTIGALNGYGMAVVTALVAQNTRGVRDVHVPPASFLEEQLRAVSEDVQIDAVKIGMLHSTALIETVSSWLSVTAPAVTVLDPVMVATSGDRLLNGDAEAAVRALCSRVDLVTPNLAELAVLTDSPRASTWAEALNQARSLFVETGAAVLVKGGHLDSALCPDALVDAEGVHEIIGERITTRNTHGTGCSLSSAMATLRAQGRSWPDALIRAKEWLTGALENADALEVGEGNGPIDHFHEHRVGQSAWSERAWSSTAGIRSRVDECSFVTGLADGTLPRERFHRYLAQDTLYLREYSRVLARASALAPTAEEQEFWARSAASAIQEEVALHRTRIGDELPEPSDITLAYVNHLHASASTGCYAELVAAVLPCFWLYTDIGVRLAAIPRDGHPYADWLGTYGDPEFAAATAHATAIADAAASIAIDSERARMTTAFERSMRHELAFFDAP